MSSVRETERLILEPLSLRHFNVIREFYATPEVSKWLGTFSDEQIRGRLVSTEEAWATSFEKWAVFKRDGGSFIGRGGISEVNLDDGTPVVEVGWGLLPQFWGCGYATEVGRAGLAFGFEEIGVQEIVSFTDRDNRASQSVMERLGLRRKGECQWHNESQVLYQLDVLGWRERAS